MDRHPILLLHQQFLILRKAIKEGSSSWTFLSCSGLPPKLNPRGVNPAGIAFQRETCFSFFAFASSAYFVPPRRPFSSLAKRTNLMLCFGRYTSALNALIISIVCTTPVPSSFAPPRDPRNQDARRS